MKKSVSVTRHDVIFNENDFGKSVGAGKFELENAQRAATKIPVESKKEDNM